MLGTTFRVTEVNVIVVRIIIVKRLPIVNLFNIMIRITISLTFELVTLNDVPNIYILGKSKHLIGIWTYEVCFSSTYYICIYIYIYVYYVYVCWQI